MKAFALLSIFAVSAFGATINQIAMSGNPIKNGITYTISVCCKKCETRALKNLKDTFKRVKDVTKCPFSNRKGTKQLTIGFVAKLLIRCQERKLIMKKILLYLMFASFAYGVTDTCPIMEGDENDADESVGVEGKKIYFCCGSYVTKFEENQAYYIKAVKVYMRNLPAERKKLVLMM